MGRGVLTRQAVAKGGMAVRRYGGKQQNSRPPEETTAIPPFLNRAPQGLDSSSGGECAQRTSRRLEQDPAGACTTKAALIARPFVVQARQDLNLQPPVLETGALPIELRAYGKR